jgi:hypothetical protein
MSHVLTEAAASADFTTGLTVPDHGDDFDDSCDVVVADVQQIADRLQWLKGWHATTPRFDVALHSLQNNSSRFAGNTSFWEQSDVTSTGGLYFNAVGLPIGRKITGAAVRVKNANTTTMPVGTPPAITLRKMGVVAGASASVLLGSATDATAVLATYQDWHEISITGLTETISADYIYRIFVTGETGANALAGLTIGHAYLTLAY